MKMRTKNRERRIGEQRGDHSVAGLQRSRRTRWQTIWQSERCCSTGVLDERSCTIHVNYLTFKIMWRYYDLESAHVTSQRAGLLTAEALEPDELLV